MLGLTITSAIILLVLLFAFFLLSHEKQRFEAATVAAATGVLIASVTALSGQMSAYFQAEAAKEKVRADVLLPIVQEYESTLVPARNDENRRQRVTILIQSGVLADPDGSICMAVVKEGCPLAVLKAK